MQAHRDEGSVYDLDLAGKNCESANTILMDADKNYKPLICRHCAAPACAKNCMSGALIKDKTSGHVIYKQEKCAQCFVCIMSCPFGVLKTNHDATAIVKCDFCHKTGGEPSCAKNCPTQTLTVQEVEVSL